MKTFRYLLKLLFFSLLIFFLKCSNNNERHIGEWKGINSQGKNLTLILDKTNHATFVSDNKILGGSDFQVNGIRADCKYEIDYSKNPIWLDIVFYDLGKNEEMHRSKGIIRFITDKKIEFRSTSSDFRFNNFDLSDKENTIVLDKISN